MRPDTVAALGALHRRDLDAEAVRHSVAQSASPKRADTGLGGRIARIWGQLLAGLTARLSRSQGPSSGAAQVVIGDRSHVMDGLASQASIRPAPWVEPNDRVSVTVRPQRLAGRVGGVGKVNQPDTSSS